MENSSVTGFLEIIELKVKAAMVSKSVTRFNLVLIFLEFKVARWKRTYYFARV